MKKIILLGLAVIIIIWAAATPKIPNEDIFLIAEKTTTPLELLKNAGFSVETKEYSFGVMIESINGQRNGEGKKYWTYYVNGEMPMISADKQEVKSGDKVEFKFAPSPF